MIDDALTPAPRGAEAKGRSGRQLAGLVLALGLTAAACGSESDALGVDTSDVSSEISSVLDGDTEAEDEAMQAGSDLRDQIGEADLTTLYSAMDLVGFDRLETDEPFTFFAPNDSAFAAIDADQLSALMADPTSLVSILEDHMVDGTVMSGDLADGTITSEGGLDLVIDTSGSAPTVNGIEIVKTDVSLGDGVIHVIDGVLLRETE